MFEVLIHYILHWWGTLNSLLLWIKPNWVCSLYGCRGNDLLPRSYRKSSGRSKLTYRFHKGICWELPTIFMWALCSQIHLDGSELSVTMTKWLKKSICQVWIALNGPQGSQVKGPAKLTEVGSPIDMTSFGEHVNELRCRQRGLLPLHTLTSLWRVFSNIHMEIKDHFRSPGSPAVLMTFKSGLFFRSLKAL